MGINGLKLYNQIGTGALIGENTVALFINKETGCLLMRSIWVRINGLKIASVKIFECSEFKTLDGNEKYELLMAKKIYSNQSNIKHENYMNFLAFLDTNVGATEVAS